MADQPGYQLAWGKLISSMAFNAYMHHDTAALLRIYAINAVSMPEYHPVAGR
jgi:hypothetical protein